MYRQGMEFTILNLVNGGSEECEDKENEGKLVRYRDRDDEWSERKRQTDRK